MPLSEKEITLLKDLKGQEKLCIEKYNKHASCAKDPQLSELFSQIESMADIYTHYSDHSRHDGLFCIGYPACSLYHFTNDLAHIRNNRSMLFYHLHSMALLYQLENDRRWCQ